MNLRNIAIIAHVDHGKTTLVDGLLKQSKVFRENEALMKQDLIMDSNDQERERGITIVAKNTAVTYLDTKINIIDTPGHADFSGEVERTLNMAEGALLLVDAKEGPMPQTKFVLRKALELGLKIIVIVNKIDKEGADSKKTIHKVSDLFLELATDESQLEFPVLYAIGREGKAWAEEPTNTSEEADLSPIFEAVLKYIPAPKIDNDSPFQMLVSSLDWDSYKGLYAIGKVSRGTIKPGTRIALLKDNNAQETVVVDKIFINKGLQRVEATLGECGDIIAITGIKTATIGNTLADLENPERLPTIKIGEPTLSISIGPNTSPFMGKEGSKLTSREILKRIEDELQTNVAMKFNIDSNGQYILSGRGELHLCVFLETLLREGFELEVGKPKVITKFENGIEVEPVEEYRIDVESEYLGAVNSEMGKRRGILLSQEETSPGYYQLLFEVTTRNILGLRGTLLTLTKGTAVVNSTFLRYEKKAAELPSQRKGVLVASETGKAVTYGLRNAQERGQTFVEPGEVVYPGMIVGLNAREGDLDINVCKGKQLTNIRSKGEDTIFLSPPIKMSLEQDFGFLEEDELLEITPENLRLRKKVLDPQERYRANRKAKS
jgi:GTP-binding protein